MRASRPWQTHDQDTERLVALLVAVIKRAEADARGRGLWAIPESQRKLVQSEAQQFLSDLRGAAWAESRQRKAEHGKAKCKQTDD